MTLIYKVTVLLIMSDLDQNYCHEQSNGFGPNYEISSGFFHDGLDGAIILLFMVTFHNYR